MRLPAKAAALAAAIPIANESLAFSRNVLFARLLFEGDFGKLMLLASVLRLAEMLTDVGIERLIVQERDGGATLLQRELHGLSILRGFCAGLVILALSYPLAMALPEGPGPNAYMMLALPPMIRGFMHLDARRAERLFNFTLTAVVEVGAGLAAIGLMLILSFEMGGYRLGLVIFVLHQLMFVGFSHAVALRRYRISFSRRTLQRVWSFGRLLVLNAGLLWITFQADRFVLAKFFNWEDLARYAIAFQLAFLPTQIITRVINSLLAPHLRMTARAGHPSLFIRSMAGFAALAAVFGVLFGLLASPLIREVYGANYLLGTDIYWAFALAGAIRILRAPVSQFAIFHHRGGDVVKASIIRASALLPIVLLVSHDPTLITVILFACLGEIAALLFGALRLLPALRDWHPASVIPKGHLQ